MKTNQNAFVDDPTKMKESTNISRDTPTAKYKRSALFHQIDEMADSVYGRAGVYGDENIDNTPVGTTIVNSRNERVKTITPNAYLFYDENDNPTFDVGVNVNHKQEIRDKVDRNLQPIKDRWDYKQRGKAVAKRISYDDWVNGRDGNKERHAHAFDSIILQTGNENSKYWKDQDFRNWDNDKRKSYLKDEVDNWVKVVHKTTGVDEADIRKNICGASLHLDEATPHVHLISTNIYESKNGEPVVRNILSGKDALAKLHKERYANLKERYGDLVYADRSEYADLEKDKYGEPIRSQHMSMSEYNSKQRLASEVSQARAHKWLEYSDRQMELGDRTNDYYDELENVSYEKHTLRNQWGNIDRAIKERSIIKNHIKNKEYGELEPEAIKKLKHKYGEKELDEMLPDMEQEIKELRGQKAFLTRDLRENKKKYGDLEKEYAEIKLDRTKLAQEYGDLKSDYGERDIDDWGELGNKYGEMRAGYDYEREIDELGEKEVKQKYGDKDDYVELHKDDYADTFKELEPTAENYVGLKRLERNDWDLDDTDLDDFFGKDIKEQVEAFKRDDYAEHESVYANRESIPPYADLDSYAELDYADNFDPTDKRLDPTSDKFDSDYAFQVQDKLDTPYDDLVSEHEDWLKYGEREIADLDDYGEIK